MPSAQPDIFTPIQVGALDLKCVFRSLSLVLLATLERLLTLISL
jgi:hypothetical protein